MDRIVEFLVRQNGLAETVTREADVAVVLRAVRDEMVDAWTNGELRHIDDVERWLNDRIRALGEQTATGDTEHKDSGRS
jgi:hypothetical protein